MNTNIAISSEMHNGGLKIDCSREQLMAYFKSVCRLVDETHNEFPVNLDDVWPLVYGRKEEAVRALTTDFQYSEGVDYKVLRRNAENPLGGRPTNDYRLSVSCLEHFIARKKREVFEVYRQFFHKVRRGEMKWLKEWWRALKKALDDEMDAHVRQLCGEAERLCELGEKYERLEKHYPNILARLNAAVDKKERK